MRLTLPAAALLILAAVPAFAAVKTYQVTGPITAMDNDSITVEKGKEKWQIAKGSAQLPADAKVGSKVTIEYAMTADKVTVKDKAKK